MSLTKYIIVGSLFLVIVISSLLLARNIKRNKISKRICDFEARFNSIKTAPIAYKLNKAQLKAKRNEDTTEEIDNYYKRYEDIQEKIDFIQEKMNDISEEVIYKGYKKAKILLNELEPTIIEVENTIKDIDSYLDSFQQAESNEREFSLRLKEEFKSLKDLIAKEGNVLAYCLEGIGSKITEIEDLFSSSEEWLYTNEYDKANEVFKNINDKIGSLNTIVDESPELIALIRGSIPTLIEEVIKNRDLSLQRGLKLSDLNIDNIISKIAENNNNYLKKLSICDIEDLKEKAKKDKDSLAVLLNDIDRENEAFDNTKESLNNIDKDLYELSNVFDYVYTTYHSNKEKLEMGDIESYLDGEKDKIKLFNKRYLSIKEDLYNSNRNCTELLNDSFNLYNELEIERKSLISYKMKIDKTSTDEEHAYKQLQKFQVVINEVETKVKESRLPSIASSYYDDLAKCKEYFVKIQDMLKEIPVNYEILNNTLEEAMNFIYSFFNNVNNIVGIAVMVENAIVFANKYRSTYPEVDQELSKAEFSYLNGEYTKALKTVITCMESLFPEIKDSEIFNNDK